MTVAHTSRDNIVCRSVDWFRGWLSTGRAHSLEPERLTAVCGLRWLALTTGSSQQVARIGREDGPQTAEATGDYGIALAVLLCTLRVTSHRQAARSRCHPRHSQHIQLNVVDCSRFKNRQTKRRTRWAQSSCL